MDDRNVQYPNRFQLTKVDGTDDIYEIIPAPGKVYTEGTFINKFALLKDTTAALFGLDVSNVPDDVLAFLGKYNQYWWKRRVNIQNAGYVEKRSPFNKDCVFYDTGDPIFTNLPMGNNPNVSETITFYSNIDINQSNGAVSYINPSSISITYSGSTESSLKSRLLNKYVKVFYSDNGYKEKIVYVGNDATVYKNSYSSEGDSYYVIGFRPNTVYEVSSEYKDSSTIGDWEYLWSTDREAYPDSGIQDGYEYQFLGIPFENSVLPLRVETGSYVGTGTYGVNNPCSLTLPFEPKLFIVGDTDGRKGTRGNYLYFALPIFLGDTYEKINWKFGGTTATQYTLMKREGSTISWYINFTGSGSDQLNGTGTTYYYYAIG